MIVLTTKEKNSFLAEKEKYQSGFNGVDIIPIEIKGGYWILPEEVLSDENFKDLWGFLNNKTKREILESEKITYDI